MSLQLSFDSKNISLLINNKIDYNLFENLVFLYFFTTKLIK